MLAALINDVAYRLDLGPQGMTFVNARTETVELRNAPLFAVTLRNGRRWTVDGFGPGQSEFTQGDLTVRMITVRKADYVREVFTLAATKGDVDVARFDVVDADIPDARVEGTTLGSPVVTEDAFFALGSVSKLGFRRRNADATPRVDRRAMGAPVRAAARPCEDGSPSKGPAPRGERRLLDPRDGRALAGPA